MLYQLQDEIDDDGMPEGIVTGCEGEWDIDDDGDWVDVVEEVDASDVYDMEYDH